MASPPKAVDEPPAEALGRGADGKRPSHLQHTLALKPSSSVQSAAWTPSPIYATALLTPPEGGGAALSPPPCLHSCITVRDLSGTRARRPHAPRACMRREPLARMHDCSGTHAPPFSRTRHASAAEPEPPDAAAPRAPERTRGAAAAAALQQLKPQALIAELRALRAAHGSVCAQLVDERARLERLYGRNAELEASEAHWRVSERAPRALRSRGARARACRARSHSLAASAPVSAPSRSQCIARLREDEVERQRSQLQLRDHQLRDAYAAL
jgi:hypothetical protein